MIWIESSLFVALRHFPSSSFKLGGGVERVFAAWGQFKSRLTPTWLWSLTDPAGRITRSHNLKIWCCSLQKRLWGNCFNKCENHTTSYFLKLGFVNRFEVPRSAQVEKWLSVMRRAKNLFPPTPVDRGGRKISINFISAQNGGKAGDDGI